MEHKSTAAKRFPGLLKEMKIKIKLTILGILIAIIVANPMRIPAEDKIHFEINYSAKISNIPENTDLLRIWIPYPQSDKYQKIFSIKTSSPYPTYIHKEEEYGNSFLYIEVENPKEREIEIKMDILAMRSKVINRLDTGAVGELDEETRAEFDRYFFNDLDAVTEKMIKKIVKKHIEPHTTYLDKVKAIYDYVYENMDYNKDILGYGEGNVIRACTVKSGNCIDFHSLFIAIARESGIVAREAAFIDLPFEEGVLNYCDANYHCGIETYLPNHGWFPLDISHAKKGKGSKEFYFGSLDNLRLQIGRGRNIKLAPKQEESNLVRLPLKPYVEANGKTHYDVDVSVLARKFDEDYIKKDRRTHLIAAGERPTPFIWRDLEGNKFDLNSILGKKPLLINFFTTWCGRCIWETDYIKKAKSQFPGIKIIRINLMESPDRVKQFADEHQVNFTILPDGKGELAELFGIKYVPTNIVIGQDGIVNHSGGFFTKEELWRRLNEVTNDSRMANR